MQVEELLQKRKIPYIHSGKDLKIHCLNPEHDDSNPSLRVDKITGAMNCFSCGFGGSIFKFFEVKGNALLIKKEILKKKIAEKLRENIGLEVPVNAVPFAREWRNISGETFRKFEAFEHNDPEFIGRVVFPIRSLSGKIVGFNARHLTLNHTPRYIISPGGARLPLYPVVKPIEGRVILVEGIFDMLNLHDKGLTNAVCCFGTQKVTKEKLNLLKVQGVTGVDVFFDGDEGGEEATKKVKDLAEQVDLASKSVRLANTDPGELTALQVIKLKEKLYG